jgi:hypothetical protein
MVLHENPRRAAARAAPVVGAALLPQHLKQQHSTPNTPRTTPNQTVDMQQLPAHLKLGRPSSPSTANSIHTSPKPGKRRNVRDTCYYACAPVVRAALLPQHLKQVLTEHARHAVVASKLRRCQRKRLAARSRMPAAGGGRRQQIGRCWSAQDRTQHQARQHPFVN